MKYLATLCLTALVAGVNSAAIAAAEPVAFCWRPGQPCGKVKRAAEAFCWRPGQPCGKAKRTALALAHAVADANPEAEAFFDKLAIREAFPEPEAVADGMSAPFPSSSIEANTDTSAAEPVNDIVKREAEAEAEAEAVAEAFCWRPGQPCGKAKREANALAEAAAEAVASL